MSASPNIVLVGFMGTGKSSAGKLVAKKLNREFVDADHEIEKRENCDIPTIFAEAGEAEFRQIETEVIRELAGRENLVIAPGGGAITVAENMENLARNGVVICLTAKPESILQRVGHDKNRPLLRGPDRLERIRELLAARAKFYDAIPLRVSTDGRNTRQVANEIIRVFNAATAAPESAA